MSLKKILIILISLLVIVIGALIVYNFLSDDETTPPSTSDPGQIPTSGSATNQPATPSYQGRLIAISEKAIMSPTIDGRKVKYYSIDNGNVFESNLDGSELTRISSVVLTNLIKALWSSNRDKVIAIFDENGQAKKYLYDYNTKISTLLSGDIRWVTWSPQQDKIAYQYYNSRTEDNNISVAQPDGSDWTSIFQTRMKDLIVEWPSSSKIAIRTKPSGLAQSIVYTINLTDNNFQKIINETYGLTVLWSPLGNKILYSETDNKGKNLKLKISDLKNQLVSELTIVTLPEKCTWSQDNRTVFCAVPKNISNLAVLPDDYYKKKISFNDDFWRINIDTGEAIKIYETTDSEANAYNAKELILPPLEDYLLFINQKDDLLYSLEL
ncbi:hypothetical protein KKE13_00840 [Patescibacteria group bacterium]|nr:hypothetical protein [Patescibacteria group bacterium]